ncbi:MAG: hypothetical protein JXB30_18820 [Anaerolineae bacterium]|nr:hypothetical protein [Anaerolineae bacterium]
MSTLIVIAAISLFILISLMIGLLIVVVKEHAMAAALVPVRARRRDMQSKYNRTTVRGNQEAA